MPSPQPSKLKAVKDIARKDILFAVARLPGTSRLLLGSSDFKVHDLDLDQAKPESRERAGHSSYVTGVIVAGQSVISGGYDGKVIWWDLDKRRPARIVDAHAKWIRALALSPDGGTVASVGDDMVCRLWDATTGTKRHELRGHKEKTPHHFPSMLHACAFSPDGKYLATGDKVGHVVIWETASGKQAGIVEAPGLYTWDPEQRLHSIGGIRALAFSADGQLLAAGGVGKINNIDSLAGPARVEVFDWAKGERTHEFSGNNGLVTHLTFHPQGEWLLAAGGGDHFVLFLDLKTKKVLHQHKAPMFIHAALLNEACDTLVAVGHNKIVVLEMKG
jgi:hypothetical protein